MLLHMKLTLGKPANAARLEHALHDDCLDVLVHLKHDHAGELFARVRLLPKFALRLENVEKFVDALHAIRLFDCTRVAGGSSIDQDLAADDGHHRRIDHVHRVLGLGEVQPPGDRSLAAGAEGHQQEHDRHDQEVDHAG